MAGVALVASARGAFSAAAKALTLAIPAAARKGDVLVALVAHGQEDDFDVPTGWAQISDPSGVDLISVFARMVDDDEPPSVVFEPFTVRSEWQGILVVLRGTAPAIANESSSSVAFSSTTALTTPGVVSQQAINLILAAWSCAGAPALTLPSGFTPIDSFATAVVSSRSMMVGLRIAGATGARAFPAASASINTTGRALSLAIRDRIPVTPGVLVDLVPGNLGLIGKDTRPAR